MSQTLNLNRLVYFVAVAETGSFTGAAQRLGITKAVVSQQIARLEAEIGTTLVMRTTRRVELTEAGRAFHTRCAPIVQEAKDAFEELAENTAAPSGTLRITAPNDYGGTAVVPVAAAFRTRYPACRVALTLTDNLADLKAGNLEMAIRLGDVGDPTLKSRRITTFELRLVAGPTLRDRVAALTEPADLAALPFVCNSTLEKPASWMFARDGHPPVGVDLESVMAINSMPACLSAVRHGAGLSVLPSFLVENLIASGELVCVLPQWRLPVRSVHAVFPATRYRPARVSAFLAMLVEMTRTAAAPALN